MTVEGLGHRLSAIRRQEKLSQEEMAERLHVSRSAYQYYERGERDLPGSLLLKVFQEFEADPLWVLEGDVEPGLTRREREMARAYRKVGMAVEHRISERGLSVPDEKKWDAIDFLFAEFLNQDPLNTTEIAPDTQRVDRILGLVA
ncbi:putative helix-turn-helix protein [Phaeobacter inhibens]|uniref:Helix-turn-helix protein n=1 Tax=Phaeobacter inhibens TaxID=221822 RepID=A0ABM6RIB9_9RHOB|nr:helix-turn-helix transcriptional regulator [Phaeobacter inhibens]AUQ51670.1 putative helix-turn-helix protein [Phaeobacter inhibens]AUQ96252.1 putative helix-turn-helix protein [Phaeobacter inhibens]AUR21475.1 putative helix-turn-helix protein [Phaeobacter inhibens]